MPESPRQRVMGTIRAWIGGGSRLPGTRLPTDGELAAELGVSRGTVRNALGELVKEGLLEWKPNIGCFVSNDIPLPVREQRRITFRLPAEHRKSGGHFLAGIEEAAATLIDLTTAAQPFHDIGKRAAEILLEDDVARKRPTRQEFLPCHLILRGTVAELAIHTER